MKIILFAALLLMGLSWHVQAQEHQVSAGVGILSSNHIADTFISVTKELVSGLAGSDIKLENSLAVLPRLELATEELYR